MFNQYREFRVLATHLNFTRAASELNLSEPTLSKHIAELEREIGCQLMTRNPVALTPAGAVYLEEFGHVIEKAEEVYARCRQADTYENVELRIARLSHRGAFTSILNRALVRVGQLLPGFSYTYENDRGTTVSQSVASGASDVGIVYVENPDLYEGLRVDKVCEMQYGILVDRRGPFAGRPVRFEELASARMASSANRKLRMLDDSARRIFADHGVEPNFFRANYDVVLDHVLEMRPDEILLAEKDLVESLQNDNPNLVEAQLVDGGDMTYPVCLLSVPGDKNPAVRLLVDELRKAAAHLSGDDRPTK